VNAYNTLIPELLFICFNINVKRNIIVFRNWNFRSDFDRLAMKIHLDGRLSGYYKPNSIGSNAKRETVEAKAWGRGLLGRDRLNDYDVRRINPASFSDVQPFSRAIAYRSLSPSSGDPLSAKMQDYRQVYDSIKLKLIKYTKCQTLLTELRVESSWWFWVYQLLVTKKLD